MSLKLEELKFGPSTPTKDSGLKSDPESGKKRVRMSSPSPRKGNLEKPAISLFGNNDEKEETSLSHTAEVSPTPYTPTPSMKVYSPYIHQSC